MGYFLGLRKMDTHFLSQLMSLARPEALHASGLWTTNGCPIPGWLTYHSQGESHGVLTHRKPLDQIKGTLQLRKNPEIPPKEPLG